LDPGPPNYGAVDGGAVGVGLLSQLRVGKKCTNKTVKDALLVAFVTPPCLLFTNIAGTTRCL
jgi:hypothetical protein